MAEPAAVSALAGHLTRARRGVSSGTAGVRLSEVCVSALAQLHGAPAADELASMLAAHGFSDTPARLRCWRGDGVRLLWNGSGQYLAVSSRHRGPELAARLAADLSPAGAAAVDLSHARTVLRLEGAMCREVLAKGCPLDVDGMQPGDCAPTVVSHFSVLLHCDGDDAFAIYVTRSFAVAFLEWLLRAGAEFGVDVL